MKVASREVNLNRIVILGSPGSGKSTLAKQISRVLDIEVYNIDKYYWLPLWQKRNSAEFRKDLLSIIYRDRWIIDGNYISSDVTRFNSADLLIYLDVSPIKCVFRIILRTALNFGRKAEHLPLGCFEKIDINFLHYAATFRLRQRNRILEVLKARKSNGTLIIVKRNSDLLKLISELA